MILNSAATSTIFTAFGFNLTPGTTDAPISLAVGYSTLLGEFQISGSVSVTSTITGDFSASGSLGTSSTAGLTIDSSGNVTQLDVTISGTLTVQGLGITASVDDLVLSYDYDAIATYAGDFLISQGMVTIATSGGDTYFSATLGSGGTTPEFLGLVLDQGSLASLYATVNSTIEAQGLTLSAANLIFKYEGFDFEIAAGGSFSMSVGPLQFASAEFGDSGSAGLKIDDGLLTKLNIRICSSLTVSGMNLAGESVQFAYTPPGTNAQSVDGNFEIGSGTVSFSAGTGDSGLAFSATFGSTSDDIAGLVINGGVLQSFYLAVTSDITIGATGSALTLSATDLVFTYVTASQNFQILDGTVSLTDSNGDFSFTGEFVESDPTDPGLAVTDGILTDLNITVTSSLTAGGLSLSATDLLFEYNETADQFEIGTGSIKFNTSEGVFVLRLVREPRPDRPDEQPAAGTGCHGGSAPAIQRHPDIELHGRRAGHRCQRYRDEL